MRNIKLPPRKYMTHGAAVIAGILATILLNYTGAPPAACGAVAPPPAHGMLYGADNTAYSALQAATGGITAERWYYKPGLPNGYRNQPGVTEVISIKPDLSRIGQAGYDAALVKWMRGLPSLTWLTVWHEANCPGNGVNPAVYKRATATMYKLVKSNRIPIRYGQIFGACSNARDWVVPGMDFYGLDGYQRRSADTAGSVFGPNLSAIRAIDGGNAPVAMTETNTLFNRYSWALATFRYWRDQGGMAWLWFASSFNGGTFPNLPPASLLQRLAREAPQV
jgi:hypothetical protein